jgi:hypothetical protein
MSMYAVFEILVMAAIVAFSVWRLARALFPKAAGNKPDGGCGSGGCGSCKGCSTFTFDPAVETRPPAVRR